jgi:hypothetical protein
MYTGAERSTIQQSIEGYVRSQVGVVDVMQTAHQLAHSVAATEEAQMQHVQGLRPAHAP